MEPMDEKTLLQIIYLYEISIEETADTRLTRVDENRKLRWREENAEGVDLQEYVLKCEEYLRFGDDVDLMTCEAFGRYSCLKVCETPKILVEAGFRRVPILYTQKHLFEALKPKDSDHPHRHGLTIPQIKAIPQLLEEPVAMMSSISRPDAVIMLLNAVDDDYDPMIAVVKPVRRVRNLQSAEATSLTVYGKRRFDAFFEKYARNGRIFYLNEERAAELERLAGIRYPGNYS